MCPIHWAAFGIAAIPASLALLSFIGIYGVSAARRAHSVPVRGKEN